MKLAHTKDARAVYKDQASSLRAEKRRPRVTRSALQHIQNQYIVEAVQRIMIAQSRRLTCSNPAHNETIPHCRRRAARTSFVGYETLSVDLWDAKTLATAPSAIESERPEPGKASGLGYKGAPHSCPSRGPRKTAIKCCLNAIEQRKVNDFREVEVAPDPAWCYNERPRPN